MTNKFVPLLKISTLAVVLAIGSIAPAQADIGAQMEKMFNSLSNTTAPGMHETAARGVVTGGSIVVRNELASVSLAHIQFPNISAGCGGFDIFGGSFSFINADQLVEFMKNIASNAVGYAFEMALDQVCAPCKAIISDFQALATAINSMNMNSCEAAQGIVNLAAGNPSAASRKIEKIGQNLSTVWGNLTDDTSAAYHSWTTSGETTSKKLKDNPGNPVTEKTNINIAFNAMKGSGTSAIFNGGTEKENIEFMMGLTGTIIFNWPDGSNGQSENDVKPEVQVMPKVTHFEEFVDGNNKTGKRVDVYQCNDNTKCLKPTLVSAGTFKGLKELFLTKVKESGVNIGLSIQNGAELTATGADIIKFIPLPIRAYLYRLVEANGPDAANSFLENCAPIIAAMIAKSYGDKIFYEIVKSLESVDKTIDVDPMRGEILKAHTEFSEEYGRYIASKGGEKELLDFFSKLMNASSSKPFHIESSKSREAK